MQGLRPTSTSTTLAAFLFIDDVPLHPNSELSSDALQFGPFLFRLFDNFLSVLNRKYHYSPLLSEFVGHRNKQERSQNVIYGMSFSLSFIEARRIPQA